MKKHLMKLLFLTLAVAWLCVVQASALEYSYAGADDFLFGRPTSDDTIYEAENPNVDRSKNVALVAPGFGTPTSYLPGSGEYLTPNLVPGALSGGLVNQVGSASWSVSEGGVSSGMSGGFLPSTSIPPAADASSGASSSQGNFSYITHGGGTLRRGEKTPLFRGSGPARVAVEALPRRQGGSRFCRLHPASQRGPGGGRWQRGRGKRRFAAADR